MELIKRLEAATGPSFTLEQEIFRAVNPNATNLSVPNNYTSSIDAALTLVPPEMREELEISTMYQVACVTLNLNHGPDDGPYYGSHKGNSIPLAICIAALKARQS